MFHKVDIFLTQVFDSVNIDLLNELLKRIKVKFIIF